MLWKIRFTVDNGYEYLKRICVVIAGSEDEAASVFKKWIDSELHIDEWIINCETKIELVDCQDGVIYSNFGIDKR